MKKILVVAIIGTVIPLCAEKPSYGIHAYLKGKDVSRVFDRKSHCDPDLPKHKQECTATDHRRNTMPWGGYARWSLSEGNSVLLRLTVTSTELTTKKSAKEETPEGATLTTFRNVVHNHFEGGAYYVHHFGGQPVGYFSMIGLTSSTTEFTTASKTTFKNSSRRSFKPSLGIGYDVNRQLGLQAIFTLDKEPIALSASFKF